MAEKPEKFDTENGKDPTFNEAMSRWDEVIEREGQRRSLHGCLGRCNSG